MLLIIQTKPNLLQADNNITHLYLLVSAQWPPLGLWQAGWLLHDNESNNTSLVQLQKTLKLAKVHFIVNLWLTTLQNTTFVIYTPFQTVWTEYHNICSQLVIFHCWAKPMLSSKVQFCIPSEPSGTCSDFTYWISSIGLPHHLPAWVMLLLPAWFSYLATFFWAVFWVVPLICMAA